MSIDYREAVAMRIGEKCADLAIQTRDKYMNSIQDMSTDSEDEQYEIALDFAQEIVEGVYGLDIDIEEYEDSICEIADWLYETT